MIRGVLFLLLIGCGRIGFEPALGDGGPPPTTPLDVRVARFTTTSPTFVEVPGASLTIPPSPGTRWLVLVSGSLQSSTFAQVAVEARYLIDGVERGIGGTQANAIDRPGPWQHFYAHDGTRDPAQVTVELRDAEAGTATLDDLHLIAVPLPAAADPLYASADPSKLVTSPTLAPLHALVLDPASAGDYVLLLLANSSDAPAESDVHTQWFDPGGQPWTDSLHMPRMPWQSNLFVRRATLGPDPVTVTLQAHSGGDLGQVQYARVLALRTDGFPSFELAHDATLQTTAAPTVTTQNTLTPTSTASRFLFLGSARVEADCSNTVPADRGVHFGVGPTSITTHHVTENCAYETTYGTARLLSSRPATLDVGFSSGNAELVVYRESSLLLIGLN